MKNFIYVGLLAILLGSCSPSTRITASWVDPEARNQNLSGQTIFIASLTRNLEVRTKLEDALADQASRRNMVAIKSSTQFRPDFYQNIPPEREIVDQIKRSGANMILTVSLIDTQSETRHVRGARTYSPYVNYRWYGGFYSYMNYWNPIFQDPGYYVTDKTYFLESNLYSLDNNQLIWSAQSETMNPGSIDSFVASYPSIIFEQLMKDGLMSRSN
ncbi:MAG: hypothetical protein EOO99_02685 [Pedobacter sp.]|nr:MAG: hypothetical protein EOO99_02685 [Pedobacter sp.]